jgi:hypothetical protein
MTDTKLDQVSILRHSIRIAAQHFWERLPGVVR